MDTRNPFSPDFGQMPHRLVGRAAMLERIKTALAQGPTNQDYTTLLLGHRGSGKTVLLTEIEDMCASEGWIVLSLDASTPHLAERIKQAVVHARDAHEGAEAADPDYGRPTRISGWGVGPVSVRRAVIDEMRPAWDSRLLLTSLASHADRAGTAVLLTVDELHSGDRGELRRFSSDLQHITKRGRLPLAVVAAGLAETKHTLLMDKKMTFFRRCARQEMPGLSEADIMEGLRHPVLDAGGTFEWDALRSAAAAAGPLPYKMQCIGHNAWKIAGAPQRSIDTQAVQEAVRLAEASFLEDLIRPAWHDLSKMERTFLEAVTDLNENATPQHLAQRIDASPHTLAETEDRLRSAGYLTEDTHEVLQLTDLMPRNAVIEMTSVERRYRSGDAAGGWPNPLSDSFSSPEPMSRCGAHMPLAKARCVLPAGHAGGHRSGRRRRR